MVIIDDRIANIPRNLVDFGWFWAPGFVPDLFHKSWAKTAWSCRIGCLNLRDFYICIESKLALLWLDLDYRWWVSYVIGQLLADESVHDDFGLCRLTLDLNSFIWCKKIRLNSQTHQLSRQPCCVRFALAFGLSVPYVLAIVINYLVYDGVTRCEWLISELEWLRQVCC